MLVDQQEYERFIAVFPRVCVDILVRDERGRVLLLRRTNEPAMGQWWFPGGRIHIGETRLDAARRKLREECALDSPALRELTSRDLFFDTPNGRHHDVTIVFCLDVTDCVNIITDAQSSAYQWFEQDSCRGLNLHPYVEEIIAAYA